jgi:hypothetical protein
MMKNAAIAILAFLILIALWTLGNMATGHRTDNWHPEPIWTQNGFGGSFDDPTCTYFLKDPCHA